MSDAYYNMVNERRIYYLLIKEINKLNVNNETKDIIINNLVNDLERFKGKDDKSNFEKWLYDEILKNKDENWLE